MSISSRHRGVVYTPPAIAERIVDQVLGDVSTKRMRRPLNILDPACGDGSFLRACADWFSSRGVQANLCGIDIDEEAIATAQQQMPTARLCVGNALISPDGLSSRTAKRCQAIDWQAVFPEVAKRGGFDVVVGNPPYVNIRRIHQSHDAEVKLLLRERFQTATGNFDLYVLFFERALQWLRPKGRFAMIVPNKIATLDYAQACRKLLLTQTRIDRVSDLANARVFPGACVYPYVLQFTKVVASQDHQVAIDRYDDTTQFSKARPTASTTIAQQSLDASGFQWSGQGIEVEQRVATAAMSDLATLHSGTTGFAAHQLAKALVDCNDDGNSFPFIVSGNIDRYSLRHGQVRFMNKFFARPTLPQQSSAISDRKRQMFSQPKITIAGMTRRLEAAWSRQPLALGVQVYAATEFKIEPLYVLGLLNS